MLDTLLADIDNRFKDEPPELLRLMKLGLVASFGAVQQTHDFVKDSSTATRLCQELVNMLLGLSVSIIRNSYPEVVQNDVAAAVAEAFGPALQEIVKKTTEDGVKTYVH